MMLQSQPQPPSTHIKTERLAPRKRKADSQDNERLSKRLGQLNLGIFSTLISVCHANPDRP